MSPPIALRWHTPDPARVEALLLGIGFGAAAAGGLAARGIRLRVERAAGPERLTVTAEHEPRPAEDGEAPGAEARSPAEAGRAADVGDHLLRAAPRLLAVGLATVDLERAAAALGGLVEILPDDALLGARAGRVADPRIVLLEPATEGRLAASLARVGEGPVAIYLAVAGAGTSGVAAAPAGRAGTTIAAPGPLGPQVLVRARPPWGPHLLLVAPPRARVAAPRRSSATIGA